jgi:hypothetical protein
MPSPRPIRLKVVVPELPRTILKQKDKDVPVFRGKESQEPDCLCGDCGNVLATGTKIRPFRPDVMRFLPYPEGGEYDVLSVSVPVNTYIGSEGGRVLIKCGSCGTFNELVPS